jgi:hypothetical protein
MTSVKASGSSFSAPSVVLVTDALQVANWGAGVGPCILSAIVKEDPPSSQPLLGRDRKLKSMSRHPQACVAILVESTSNKFLVVH